MSSINCILFLIVKIFMHASVCTVYAHADPSMLEYDKRLSIKDFKQFSAELVLSSVPGDNTAFWNRNAMAFTSSYEVCVDINLLVNCIFLDTLDW